MTVDSVTTQPASQTVNSGQSVTFTTASLNPGSAGHRAMAGEYDGGSTFTAISGATSLTYNFTATASQNGDEYRPVFSNSEGTFAGSPATLKVDSVTTQPASQTVNAGQSVTFSTASSNPGGADTVQWQVSTDGGTSFTPITGATSLTYTFTATASQNGDEYEAVFTNSAGSFDSNPATLTVAANAVPTVTTQPSATLAEAGGNATFTAAASGSPMPTVQWEVNTGSGFNNVSGSEYSGATTGTLTITGATAAMNGYTYEAVFTNSSGSVTTNAATLTVDSVTTQPASQTVTAGQSVTFTTASSNPGAQTRCSGK